MEAKILTRYEKDAALSHNEMDKNLCSLIHTASVSETGSEKDAQFVTFSYAPQPTKEGTEQVPPISFQIKESAEEICRKIADEHIPGDLHVDGTLHVNDIVSKKSFDTSIQSDGRLKEHVHPFYSSLDRLTQIEPVNFIWKEGAEKSGSDVGVIAQQIQSIYPEAVCQGEDGYYRVDYIKLVPLLIGAVKELSERVTYLEERR